MKYRSKLPPEAVPFRQGKRPVSKRAGPAGLEAAVTWLSPAAWPVFTAERTTAHRIVSGPDFWVERFGDDLLLSYQTEQRKDEVLAELEHRCATVGFKPARVFGKFLPHHASERVAPVLLQGSSNLAMETEVMEYGVRYGLDFAGGYSAGLFIDQRGNRARVRALKPKRLLNTFAYTCSFSVVAASAGAETLSLDLSRRSLARGEENLRRNGLDARQGHRFLADDVLAVLPRLARRGEKFDAIILDPPTFSRNESGRAFKVQRDFEQLVSLALEVAGPRAHLLLSVNHSEMRIADLERSARSALKMAGRGARFSSCAPLVDFPAGHGAKTVWLELG